MTKSFFSYCAFHLIWRNHLSPLVITLRTLPADTEQDECQPWYLVPPYLIQAAFYVKVYCLAEWRRSCKPDSKCNSYFHFQPDDLKMVRTIAWRIFVLTHLLKSSSLLIIVLSDSLSHSLLWLQKHFQFGVLPNKVLYHEDHELILVTIHFGYLF